MARSAAGWIGSIMKVVSVLTVRETERAVHRSKLTHSLSNMSSILADEAENGNVNWENIAADGNRWVF